MELIDERGFIWQNFFIVLANGPLSIEKKY